MHAGGNVLAWEQCGDFVFCRRDAWILRGEFPLSRLDETNVFCRCESLRRDNRIPRSWNRNRREKADDAESEKLRCEVHAKEIPKAQYLLYMNLDKDTLDNLTDKEQRTILYHAADDDRWAVVSSPTISARNQIEALLFEERLLGQRHEPWRNQLLSAGLAANSAILSEVQALLSLSHDLATRVALAGNVGLVEIVQRVIASREECDDVLIALAHNPSLNPTVMPELATSYSIRARAAIAANPRLPAKWQIILTGDFVSEVRAAAASNAHLMPIAQSTLATDPEITVRRALAENPNVTPEAAAILGQNRG